MDCCTHPPLAGSKTRSDALCWPGGDREGDVRAFGEPDIVIGIAARAAAYGKSLDGDAANDTTTKPSLRYTQFSKFVSRTKAKKLLVRSARPPLLPGVRTRGATSVSLLGPHIHIRAR